MQRSGGGFGAGGYGGVEWIQGGTHDEDQDDDGHPGCHVDAVTRSAEHAHVEEDNEDAHAGSGDEEPMKKVRTEFASLSLPRDTYTELRTSRCF